jgi:hypothetical protein
MQESTHKERFLSKRPRFVVELHPHPRESRDTMEKHPCGFDSWKGKADTVLLSATWQPLEKGYWTVLHRLEEG